MAEQTVIYDFGSNNGDDIPYYLLKAERVVAVEANLVLSNHIRERFKAEIDAGRLVVESCVLTVGDQPPNVPFYIHKRLHVKSQFPRPSAEEIADYEEVVLPSRKAIDVVRQYGSPHYIKIDIEYYDHVILRDLLANKIVAPYISAESHSIKCFCLLVAAGYGAFKLVDGPSVHVKYADHEIETRAGKQRYKFPAHAAGPFGNDIRGPWMTDDNLCRVLGYAGLGWKDVHASGIDAPNPGYCPNPSVHITMDY
jgi:FkbM family methyltransferase